MNKQENQINSYKKYKKIVNQILKASTIQSDVLKILIKLYNKGKKFITDKEIDEIETYGKEILETTNLEHLMNLLNLKQIQSEHTFEQFIEIIKYFVLNQKEKDYLDLIWKEIQENEKLEGEVQQAMKEVENENQKKIAEYEKYHDNPDTKKLKRDIETYENKLEKAHQKLNQTIFQNEKLREKIDLLRKEKKIVEEIYISLKQELEEKKDQIEKTIVDAGRAHINRNIAENELKILIDKAQKQKKEFESEFQKINEEIQHDKKFCEFLKEKHKDKEKLQQLEAEIKKNQEYINQKKKQNEKINQEYQESLQREKEIKEAFEQVKKETGVNKFEDLLPLFKDLHDKNNTINLFVEELQTELTDLESQIEELKNTIKLYNIQNDDQDDEKNSMKIKLDQQIQNEKKKQEILELQYKKSIETIQKIKDFLIELFKNLEIEQDKIDALKNSALTTQNLTHFLGLLEEKGMNVISECSKIIAEQIKKEKGDQEEVNEQINNLVNIIEYENNEILKNQQFMQKNEFPEHLFKKENQDPSNTTSFKKYDELKKKAINELWKVPKQRQNLMNSNSKIQKNNNKNNQIILNLYYHEQINQLQFFFTYIYQSSSYTYYFFQQLEYFLFFYLGVYGLYSFFFKLILKSVLILVL